MPQHIGTDIMKTTKLHHFALSFIQVRVLVVIEGVPPFLQHIPNVGLRLHVLKKFWQQCL